jgi:hypothetical protein
LTDETTTWIRDLPMGPPGFGEGDIEERLARLEAEAAIRDLVARWVYYHDAGLLKEKVGLHHPDCVIHHRAGSLVGLEAIEAFLAAGPPNERIKDMRHRVSSQTIRFDTPEQAHSFAQYLWTQTITGPGQSRAAVGGGWYADLVVREGREWLFRERWFHRTFDFTLPGVSSFGEFAVGGEALRDHDLQRLREAGILRVPTDQDKK